MLLRDGKIALRGNDFASEADGAEWIGLREAWQRLGDRKWQLAVREQELQNFRKSHRYCGHCGGAMEESSEISLKCRECGREIWPGLSPAIVVLVTRDEGREALLVHAKDFIRPDMYALVAGFVETGETLEECVAREVREETSLEITDIRYAGSQSWPFPGQMMIGFTARYKSGDMRLADGELSAGGWFSRTNLPPLPTPPSLSHEIIYRWIKKELG